MNNRARIAKAYENEKVYTASKDANMAKLMWF